MKGIVEDAIGLDVTFKDGTERRKYVVTIGGVKYDFWSPAIMEKIGEEVEFEVTPNKNPDFNAKGILTGSVHGSDTLTHIGDVKKRWGEPSHIVEYFKSRGVALSYVKDMIIGDKIPLAEIDTWTDTCFKIIIGDKKRYDSFEAKLKEMKDRLL